MPPETDILLSNLQYFFSTAPQVLGALIAITGAFALFKFDGMKKEMFGYLDLLVQFQESGNECKDMFDRYFSIGSIRLLKTSLLTQNHVPSSQIILKALHKMNEDPEEHFDVEDYDRLSWICVMFDISRERIEQFKGQSKRLLAFNGIFLTLLLAAFLAIPKLALNHVSYLAAMWGGFAISCCSLGYIIFFVARSFEAKLMEDQKNFGPHGMEVKARVSNEKIEYNLTYHNDIPSDED